MNKKTLGSLVIVAATVITLPTVAFAESKNNFDVDLGSVTLNVKDVAQKYGVEPNELQQAIIQDKGSEHFSPFSKIKTKDNELKPSVSVETRGSNRKITRWNQDSTAYTAPRWALTASGKTPQIGMAAMHINVTTTTQNSTAEVLKLGKPLYMTKPVNIHGKNYNTFILEDRGQPVGKSRYWVDFFFGEDTAWGNQQAINYGNRKVSYYYWVK